MSGTEAVLFDLDDTLFAHREAVADGLLSHVRGLGHPYDLSDPDVEIARWRDLEEHHYHRYLAGELSHEGQRRERSRDYAASHGVDLASGAADAWFASYFARYTEHWRLHEDARPCVDALRLAHPGLRLGIITNGELDYQTRKIDALGVRDWFDVIVASGEVGFTKPDARIFRLACERLGVAPEHAVYVGDRLRTDAIGAAHAGLTGVWLDRIGIPPSEADRADSRAIPRITTLAALPPLLA